MKKILFVITTFQGTGGHYYSLCSTAKMLSSEYEVLILNLGRKISPVIEKSGLPYEYLFFKGNYIQTWRNVFKLITDNHIDVVHCFDIVAYLASIISSHRAKVPIILTKCGGPVISPQKFPVVDNLILYTKEDKDFFSTHHKYNKTSIHLIPNRVDTFSCDEGRIKKLVEEFHLKGKRVIIRIGRISSFYEHTAVQSINLVKQLYEMDDRFVLLLIGNVANHEVLANLERLSTGCDYIYILTESGFTLNAKELLDAAEFVIGTGRGFMEACQKNKKMFAPCKNTILPIYVTRDNFDDIFAYNFSERYTSPSVDYPIDEWIRQINSGAESYSWYKEYFSIDEAKGKYISIYTKALPAKIHTKSLIYPYLFWKMKSIESLRRIYLKFAK